MADNSQTKIKTTISLRDVYDGYAEKATAKDDFEFSLLETYDVKFTKDFKGIKKGHKLQGISKVAFDLYDANGVVEMLKKKEGPTDKELDEAESK